MPSHFTRTVPPPSFQQFRQVTRLDFRLSCAYCLTLEEDLNGPELYDLDHFRPKSKFPELERDFDNHYSCCKRCNGIKRDKWPSNDVAEKGIGFVDLRASDFEAHYRVQDDLGWAPLTPSARYTIEQLRLDSPALLAFRR